MLFSCHSHPTLQLSGLLSSRRGKPCLPSGLLHLPDSDDTIMLSYLESDLKQMPLVHVILTGHTTQMLLTLM